MNGPILLSDEAAEQLSNEKMVVVFNQHEYDDQSEKEYTRNRDNPVEGVARIQSVEYISPDSGLDLGRYVGMSAYDTVGDWSVALRESHSNLPDRGYLYLLTTEIEE